MHVLDVQSQRAVRERLRVSTRVGDERIEVATRDDDVVLLGTVASPEEATVAGQLAEEYATSVVNELEIDRGLREGWEEPLDTEPASPAALRQNAGQRSSVARSPGVSPASVKWRWPMVSAKAVIGTFWRGLNSPFS